jgi:arylsulfatase A-like enzyme
MMETHSPYLARAPYDTFYAGRRIEPRPQFEQHFSAREIRGFVDAYDQALTYTDFEIGRIFAALRARGVLDRTIILITADHGEQLGERGVDELLHGGTLYLTTLHVPLIIRHPGEPMVSRRVTSEVSLRDVASTILELAQIENGGRIPGVPLGMAWRNDHVAAVSPAVSQLSPRHRPKRWLQSLLTGRYHYIDKVRTDEVYDVNADPWERTDLSKSIGQGELSDLEARLRASHRQ